MSFRSNLFHREGGAKMEECDRQGVNHPWRVVSDVTQSRSEGKASKNELHVCGELAFAGRLRGRKVQEVPRIFRFPGLPSSLCSACRDAHGQLPAQSHSSAFGVNLVQFCSHVAKVCCLGSVLCLANFFPTMGPSAHLQLATDGRKPFFICCTGREVAYRHR